MARVLKTLQKFGDSARARSPARPPAHMSPHMSTHMSPHQETGATLIEALMVMGIAVSFVVGSVALYSVASKAGNIRQLAVEIIGVIAELQASYGNGQYPYDPTLDTNNNGVNPIQARNVPTNPWGGDVVVRTTDRGRGFQIILDQVPNSECENVIQQMAFLRRSGIAVAVVSRPLNWQQGPGSFISNVAAFNYQINLHNGTQCQSSVLDGSGTHFLAVSGH